MKRVFKQLLFFCIAVLTIIAVIQGFRIIINDLWPHLFFLLGAILLFDVISYAINGDSLLRRIIKNWPLFVYLWLGGFFIEVFMDSLGIGVFKSWEYPIFKQGGGLWLYFAGAPIGLFFLYESYAGTSALLRKLSLTKQCSAESPFKSNYMQLVGIIGLLLFISSFIFAFAQLFNPWYIHFFAGFGFLGILEFSAWKLGRETLLSHLVKGDMIPLFSMFLLSFTIAWIWEVMNIKLGGDWVYVNLPVGTPMLTGGVPLIAIIQWLFLYSLFILFYTTFFSSRDEPCPW